VEILGAPTTRVLSAVAVTALLVFTAGPAAAAPPPNDHFASRTTIPAVPFSEVVSTLEATTEPAEPSPACGPIGKTVWYEYTPPADTVLGASTAGSGFDTLTGIWTGSSLGALTPVACSDSSRTVFGADGGTTYLIQLGGWEGDAGTLSFRLREVDAGFISGTVTEAGTGMPLDDICVDISDADLPNTVFESTDSAGHYRVAVRPGTYVVFFEDQCDESSDHRSEWYDDAHAFAQATEVVVASKTEVSGIDAALELACPGFGSFQGEHLIGTDGPDHLTGGPGADVFCGFRGDDRFHGEGGRDFAVGDEGRDRLFGGDGSDSLHGGPGRDRLAGGTGGDDVSGRGGSDKLSGGGDTDFMAGGSGRDRLAGGPEHDRMFGDTGDDQMSGGAANDFLEGEKGSDRLFGGGGDDNLHGKDGDDGLRGGPGKDLCNGDEGQDTAGPSCERTKDVP
jgi:Ca2+-binding RTX toxin-like protein